MFAVVLTTVHGCISILTTFFTLDLFVVFEAQKVFQLRKVLLMARHEIVHVVDGVPAEFCVLGQESFIGLLRLPIAR